MFFTKDLILAQEYLAFVLLNLFDLFLTGYIFKHQGMEANGIAAWVLTHFGRHGLLAFAIFKFLLVTAVVLICEVIATHKLKSARLVIMLGILVYGFVVVYESALIFKHIDQPETDTSSAVVLTVRPAAQMSRSAASITALACVTATAAAGSGKWE